MNKEKLQDFANFLRKVPSGQFNFIHTTRFRNGRFDGCALGQLPKFNNRFAYKTVMNGTYLFINDALLYSEYGENYRPCRYDDVANFFGITYKESCGLFDYGMNPNTDEDQQSYNLWSKKKLTEKSTAKEVADSIEAFIKYKS